MGKYGFFSGSLKKKNFSCGTFHIELLCALGHDVCFFKYVVNEGWDIANCLWNQQHT